MTPASRQGSLVSLHKHRGVRTFFPEDYDTTTWQIPDRRLTWKEAYWEIDPRVEWLGSGWKDAKNIMLSTILYSTLEPSLTPALGGLTKKSLPGRLLGWLAAGQPYPLGVNHELWKEILDLHFQGRLYSCLPPN